MADAIEAFSLFQERRFVLNGAASQDFQRELGSTPMDQCSYLEGYGNSTSSRIST